MIHPINLPEELLCANPARPSLINLRRKPRITYTADRKMIDGRPTTPKTPTGLWESALVRGFVHRMAYDIKGEVEETSSIESLIDVIDLEPSNHSHSNANLLSPSAGVTSPRPDRGEKSSDDHGVEPKFAFSLRATGDILQENDIEGVRILRRSSGQFRKPKPSAIIDQDVISPILQPCCSSSELHNFCLKEFLRFDFSNSEVFSDFCEHASDDKTEDEADVPQRKTSIELLPNAVGSRIWFNKPLSKSNSIGNAFDSSFARSSPSSRSKLCFHIRSVNVANDTLHIQILALNNHPRKLRLETSLHLHAAKAQNIGRKFLTKENVFELEDTEENTLDFKIDLTDEAARNIALDAGEYIVITLLGHIHV